MRGGTPRGVAGERDKGRRAVHERVDPGEPVPQPLVAGEVLAPLQEAEIVHGQDVRRVAGDRDRRGRRQPEDVDRREPAIEPWPTLPRARHQHLHVDVQLAQRLHHAGCVMPDPAPVAGEAASVDADPHARSAVKRSSSASSNDSSQLRLQRTALWRASPARSAAAHSARARPSTLGSPATRFGEIAASAFAVLLSNVFVTASIPAAAIAIGVGPGWGACSSARPTSYSP